MCVFDGMFKGLIMLLWRNDTLLKKKPSNSSSNEYFRKSFVSMHVDFSDSQNIVVNGEKKRLSARICFVATVTNFFENMLLTNEIKILSSNRQTTKLLQCWRNEC